MLMESKIHTHKKYKELNYDAKHRAQLDNLMPCYVPDQN